MTDQSFSRDHARLTEPTTLVIQRWLPGPAERIWAYLTESELRRKWLASGEMTGPGAEFEFVWRNDELSRSDDIRPEGFPAESRMASRVITFDPPRHLAFAWEAGDVEILLEPKGDRVLLTLTHRGIADRPTRLGIAAGWHMHLDVLAAEAAGEVPPSFWSGWQALRRDYETRLPE